MATLYFANGIGQVKLPVREGGKTKWVRCSTGTKDRTLARRMAEMADELVARRAWDIIDPITSRRRTLASTFDDYALSGGDLAQVRAGAKDVLLLPLVDEWLPTLKDLAPSTVKRYEGCLATFVQANTRASHLQRATLQGQIDGIQRTAGTVRYYAAAISAFCGWLVRRGHLTTNPMRDVQLPRVAKPRDSWLEPKEVLELAAAKREPYRSLDILMAGTGIELSVALKLKRSDVDAAHKEIRAAGTKTHARDRVVRVAEWAWGTVERLLAGLQARDLLFGGIPDRQTAYKAHTEARKRLKGIYTRYQLRDHRHTWAVRMVRAGVPLEVVARQLGHVNSILVQRVYGKFVPSQDERRRWEEVASARETERRRDTERRDRSA